MAGKTPGERLISEYLKALSNSEAAIFAGSGLSVDSGIVDWGRLLQPIAEDLGLNIERERDMVGLAQYYVNSQRGNRHRVNQLILDEIGRNARPNTKHEILARLPIDTYWTTNYDKLLEKALEAQGKRVDVRYDLKHLAVSRTRRDAVVTKMHGDVDHPDDAVLIRDDYERYHLKMEPYVAALIGDLLDKTFLFVGLSFEDPNIHYVLGRIRAQYGGITREHFCVMRRRQRKDGEDEDEYRLDAVRQELFAEDLKRFNITTVFVEEFGEVEALLTEIERRYRRNSVFISGSAHSYEPWSATEVEGFVGRLAGALVERGFRIVTGFGLGIGNFVVTGALTAIYQGQRQLDDCLVMRPFPFVGSALPPDPETMRRHRDGLLSLSGVALFMFGNKQDGGTTIPAEGVRREFELALGRGVLPVPIGATGWVSAELYEEVMSDFAKYYSDAELALLFRQLDEHHESLDHYIEPILQIVTTLRGAA